jgi:hypothetical protein
MSRFFYSLLPVGALLFASLACAVTVAGPTPPASPIPVSTEAAGQLAEVWKQALTHAENGQVNVVITEEQLTSFLAIKLAEQENPPLTNPQVFLRDNKIRIYGDAKAQDVTTTAVIVLSVVVTPEGTLALSVDSAALGPVSLPASALDQLTTVLNTALTGQGGELTTGFKITSAVIVDGQLAIVGALNK